MNNKKGFSLVELLAVIVILGILSTSAIIGVSYVINNAKREKIKRQESALVMAAQAYYQANKEYLPKNIGEVEEVYAYTLYDKKFLKKEIENEKGEKCMNNSYVSVHKTSKGNYKYKAFLYCGSDTRADDEKGKPTISILFTDEEDNINAFQNVSRAKLVIRLTGGIDPKTNKEIPIEGYSFSIATKAGANPYMDDYNSGTLSGNNKTEITINKALREFIDVTKANDVRVTVNVTNVDGGVNTFTRSTDESYSDSTKPFCSKVIQQAKKTDDWINANDYYNNNKKRKATVLCEDGYGSGCVRGQFTRTWPNKYQKDAEYGYIQVSDNAGNVNLDNSFVNVSNPCSESFMKDSCRVLVKVDTTYPKITIDAYKRGSDGKKTGNSIFKSSVTKTVGGGSTSTGPSEEVGYDSYLNLTNNWMNDSKYEYGVVYKVSISDNLHLASWKWETNAPYQTSRGSDFKKYGDGSESKSKTIDDSSIDMNKNNCGPRTVNDFYVSFEEEGLRRGRLTVKDDAGNKTVFYIEAYLDRTAPPKPKVEFTKYDGSKYTTKTWSNQYVKSKLTNPGDKKAKNGNKTLSQDLSGFSKYQYKGSRAGGTIDEHDGTLNFDSDLYEGKNKIKYRACDKAGNCSSYTDEYDVWVDTKEPTITLKAYSDKTLVYNGITANSSNNNRKVEYNKYNNLISGWMNKDNYSKGVTYEITMNDNVSLNNYKWTSSSGNESKNISGKGPIKLSKTIAKNAKVTGKIEVFDSAGNKSTITADAWIDRVAPSKPTITNPKNNTWTNSNVDVKLESTDNSGGSGIGKYQYGSWSDFSNSNKTSFTYTYSNEQNNTINYRACDVAGNCSASNSTVLKIDKTAPDAPSVDNKCSKDNSNCNNKWTNKNVDITVSGGDDKNCSSSVGCSGRSLRYQYRESGTSTWSLVGSSNKVTYSNAIQKTVYYRSCDNAGNCSDSVSTKVEIDKTAPTMLIKVGPDGICSRRNGEVWTVPTMNITDNASGLASVKNNRNDSQTYTVDSCSRSSTNDRFSCNLSGMSVMASKTHFDELELFTNCDSMYIDVTYAEACDIAGNCTTKMKDEHGKYYNNGQAFHSESSGKMSCKKWSQSH